VSGEFVRTKLLIGDKGLGKLKNASVAVFGVGGVGSFVSEALARSGIGRLVLVDRDTINLSNINRQLIATHSSLGRLKVEVMRERIFDINPNAQVDIYPVFYTAENADDFDYPSLSYIVDAIDTVSSKLTLIEHAKAAGVPIISCMGAGNKLDPTQFEVADIYKTSVCPLARVMRYELRKRGIKDLKVVYSKEPPLKPKKSDESSDGRKQVPGSISYVPSSAGLIIAGQVIRDIAGV
jgi:tRNA A37 threonylcarbamoyladenosine dehydratase